MTFSFAVHQIVTINLPEKYMEMAVTLDFNWFDSFLTWRPEMNGGITELSVWD